MRVLSGAIVFALLAGGQPAAHAAPGCGFYAQVSRACGCKEANFSPSPAAAS